MAGYQAIQDAGEGIVQVGEMRGKACWRFQGLQRLLDAGSGHENLPGIIEKATWEVCFSVFDLPVGVALPAQGTQTELTINGTTYQPFVHWFQAVNGQVRLQLSNQIPNGVRLRF